VSATIKTAIQGGSYEDNLTASLKTAGIDTVAGWAASNLHGNPAQQTEQAKTMTAGDFLSFLSNSFNANRLSK
jgi:hypothetical protein